MTLSPAPPDAATAQNNPNSGDQQTEYQLYSAEPGYVVHVIPSDEVMTVFPDPDAQTAQNNPNSGDQQTEFH